MGNKIEQDVNRQRRLETPFSSLPLQEDHPQLSAWGLWGSDDERGTLNLLDEESVQKAMQLVQIGEVISLDLPLDAFLQPMNPVRKPCEHRMIAKGHANDDELHINTQGSSHWDGLRHYPYQKTLQYYNGVTQKSISGESPTNQLGIQNIASKSITGRGVLLDWASWAATVNTTYDPFSTHAIPLSQIKSVVSAQNVAFQPGDILFVRTGWLSAFQSLTAEQQMALPQRSVRSSIGLESSEEMIEWHWKNAFAAVASDTVAYESWPSARPNRWDLAMHEIFLSGWGMPIGESFNLENLAQRCRKLGRWDFAVVSVPLKIPGGVASPPNAVAIL